MPLSDIRWEELQEAVRRHLWRADPMRPLRSARYCSRHDAEQLQHSLLAALPTSIAEAIAASRAAPPRKLSALLPHEESGLPVQRSAAIAVPLQVLHSAVPPALRVLAGIRSGWTRTATGSVFYLDSGPPPVPRLPPGELYLRYANRPSAKRSTPSDSTVHRVG
jgi:hypothetical protein